MATEILPVAVVVPCFRVRRHIAAVLAGLQGRVAHVYVVDDCCPEQTGRFVQENCADANTTVLFHEVNLGVGGAVVSGYRRALADGFDIVVKMDGDNQMDPDHLPALVAPIRFGLADYTKGNRFFDLYLLETMPLARLMGNGALSFLSKVTSGYWDIMDPTNGYTAIHRVALERLPLDRLEQRYFFESDMLFRLGTVRAVVADVPMPAVYGDETSNLKISRILMDFPGRYLSRIGKRFFYMYLLRDFNIASVETIAGTIAVVFGTLFGLWHWIESVARGRFASTGTVMVAVLPIIVGIQFLLSAINVDIANRPTRPLQSGFGARRGPPASGES